MSDENHGTRTDAEQTAIQNERGPDADAEIEKTLNSAIAVTVIMVVFSAVMILVYGFKDEQGTIASFTAIGLSVIVSGIKWFLEIKNQIRWNKNEAREKAEGSDRHVL